LRELGRLVRETEARAATNEFVRLALYLAGGRNDLMTSAGMAEPKGTDRVKHILKTAVGAGTMAEAVALADYQTLASSFVASLQGYSAYDTMLLAMRRMPLKTRIFSVTLGGTGSNPTEGKAKPITKLTLANSTLEPKKAAGIIVISEELARAGGAATVALMNTELRTATVNATDSKFLSDLANSVVPIVSTGGPLNDLHLLLNAVTVDASSRLYLIVASTLLKQLAFRSDGSGGSLLFPNLTVNGGEIQGVVVIPSDNLQQSSGGNVDMMLIDSTAIAAESDTIVLDQFSKGALQLETQPDDPATASTVMTSLWQSGLVALRAERWFGYEILRSSGIAVMSGADYSIGGSGAL
jgi:HK97 family phage major capsid protein